MMLMKFWLMSEYFSKNKKSSKKTKKVKKVKVRR